MSKGRGKVSTIMTGDSKIPSLIVLNWLLLFLIVFKKKVLPGSRRITSDNWVHLLIYQQQSIHALAEEVRKCD